MLKTQLRTLFRNATGYDIHKVDVGHSAMMDIDRILNKKNPTLFDVGANSGQTIDELLRLFPEPHIHAFEPGLQAFEALRRRHARNAKLNNFGLGSSVQELDFFESKSTDMSSFLPIGEDGWGREGEHKTVTISTIDSYCDMHGINHIDLLKTDTQGFDLEVLKGARLMFKKRAVSLICTEINFARMYDGQARADKLLEFAFDAGFDLVSIYKMNFINAKAGWADALFAIK